MSKLGGLGDYVVINVSSPNTPGLRALQGRKALEELVVQVKVRRVVTSGMLLEPSPECETRCKPEARAQRLLFRSPGHARPHALGS